MKHLMARSGEGIDCEGNEEEQQKAIVGREIDLELLPQIASQPTRGLDVGAIEYDTFTPH